MAWTLKIYAENGTTLLDTVTDADAVPRIDGGFKIVVRPTGDCVSMQFRGRNDLLLIRPRYIIQFNADGNDLFWGVVVRNPSLDSKGSGSADSGRASDLEEFFVEGGKSLLTANVSGPRYFETSVDVGDLFKEFLFLYGNPILSANLSLIPTAGAVLTRYYRPFSQLDVVFDEMVSSLPDWVWGVNAVGRVFLKPLDGMLSFNASQLLDFVYRPNDSEDVITKVTFVIAGSPAGSDPDDSEFIHYEPPPSGRFSHTFYHYTYVPLPVTFSYEHPLHSVYGAARSFALPEGVSPFYEPSVSVSKVTMAGGGWGAITNPANMYDDDPTTYAVVPENTGNIFYRSYKTEGDFHDTLIKGFRVVYSGSFLRTFNHVKHDSHVSFHIGVAGMNGAPFPRSYLNAGEYASILEVYHELRPTPADEVPDENGFSDSFYGVYPPSTQMAAINRDATRWTNMSESRVSLKVANLHPSSTTRFYYFYPLLLNHELLTEIAKSNLKVPRSMPGDAIVKGYSPPVPVVEVIGVLHTGGTIDDGTVDGATVTDVTVDLVDVVEYVLTPQDGFVTRYVIGNSDISQAGRLLRQYVRDGITDANYALTMMARQ